MRVAAVVVSVTLLCSATACSSAPKYCNAAVKSRVGELVSDIAMPQGAIQTQYSAPECDDSADLVHAGRGFDREGTIPELLETALDKEMLASGWAPQPQPSVGDFAYQRSETGRTFSATITTGRDVTLGPVVLDVTAGGY